MSQFKFNPLTGEFDQISEIEASSADGETLVTDDKKVKKLKEDSDSSVNLGISQGNVTLSTQTITQAATGIGMGAMPQGLLFQPEETEAVVGIHIPELTEDPLIMQTQRLWVRKSGGEGSIGLPGMPGGMFFTQNSPIKYELSFYTKDNTIKRIELS